MLNMPYEKVRAVIIKNGWTPTVTKRREEIFASRVLHFWDKGYTEIDDCAGTGIGYCVFNFQNEKGIFLRVTTQETPIGKASGYSAKDQGPFIVNYGITDHLD